MNIYFHWINLSNIKINSKYEKIKTIPTKMPNLEGLTAGDIIDIFSEINVKFKIKGTGKVYKQIPEENEIITKDTIIEIYLQ